MRACGDVKGRRVLDLGCGQGYFSRVLARAGAKVCAVDISEQQIANAVKHEQKEPLGIEYFILDAVRVGERWAMGSFDMVTACMVLGDTLDPALVLKAARAVLTPEGRCVFSDAHPVMDVPDRGWERDETGRKTMYKFGSYFDSGPALCH